MVAFVGLVGRWHQIWIQLLAGGSPLQITHDDGNHNQPRWAPDSSTLIYHRPSDTNGEPGVLYEISALGGHARPITASMTTADVSHAGDRIAFFLGDSERFALMTCGRDGSGLVEVAILPASRGVSRLGGTAATIIRSRSATTPMSSPTFIRRAGWSPAVCAFVPTSG